MRAAWAVFFVVIAFVGHGRAADGEAIDAHAIFVANHDARAIVAIDPDFYDVGRPVPVDLAPRDISVSTKAHVLIAIDAESPRFELLDLQTSTRRLVDVPFVPKHLVASPDEVSIALLDSAAGRVALVDLTDPDHLEDVSSGSPITAAVFDASGGELLVATNDRVVAFDPHAAATVVRASAGTPFVDLIRAPAERSYFGLDDAGRIWRDDHGRGFEPAGHGERSMKKLALSGSGQKLFASAVDGDLAIMNGDGSQTTARLRPTDSLAPVSAAWLDTVAFVTDSTRNRLEIIDLDRSRADGWIDLPAAPTRTVVGGMGDKLFVALAGTPRLALVDAQRRTLARAIDLPFAADLVTAARSWGICH